MDKQIKFSIIIPVYNVEAYLHQCVDSVLEQNYDNYEIILSDDGSTDSSSEICDSYASLNDKVILVRNKNSGSSVARNSANEIATGEYIIYLDSDDYWDNKNALTELNEHLVRNHSDVVSFRVKCIDNSGNETFVYPPQKEANPLKYLEDNISIWGTAWNKAIKSTLFRENDLSFVPKITSEDLDWAARLLIYGKSFSVLNSIICVHRISRANSISNALKMENLKNLKLAVDLISKYSSMLPENCIKTSLYRSYLAYEYGTLIYCCTLVKDENIKEFLDEVNDMIGFLEYSNNKKIVLLRVLYKLFGFKTMFSIVRLISKIRKR